MATQKYDGGCQCGAVRWKTSVDTDQAIACNCSRCGRLGLYLCFAPEAEFDLVSGSDAVTTFKFNKHAINHYFCKTCGVQSYAATQAPDGTPMVAVNIRCIDGIDANELHPNPYNGRD